MLCKLAPVIGIDVGLVCQPLVCQPLVCQCQAQTYIEFSNVNYPASVHQSGRVPVFDRCQIPDVPCWSRKCVIGYNIARSWVYAWYFLVYIPWLLAKRSAITRLPRLTQLVARRPIFREMPNFVTWYAKVTSRSEPPANRSRNHTLLSINPWDWTCLTLSNICLSYSIGSLYIR